MGVQRHFAEEQNETQIALRFETKGRRDTSRLPFAFAKVMRKKSKTLLGRPEHSEGDEDTFLWQDARTASLLGVWG